jgi:hypothetical protein
MRALAPALAFLAGSGVAASAFWVGRSPESAPIQVGGSKTTSELVARIEDLEARLDEIARSAPAAARVSEPAPATSTSGTSGASGARSSTDPAAGAPGATPAAASAGDLGRFANLDELRKLRDAPDDETRLKVARELLKSENPMASMAALRVLADLAPKEALAAIDGWVAANSKGDGAAWQVERALAMLVDSKGAATLGTDLDAKLRDWYRVGDEDLKRATARDLESRGDSAPMQQLVAGYRGALGNADVGARVRAVESLGRTRSKEAVPALVPMLSDGSDEVRLGALDALRRTGNEAAIEKVTPLLNDPVAAVRDRATRTIESLRRGEREPDWRGGDFRGGDFRGGGFPQQGGGGRRGNN